MVGFDPLRDYPRSEFNDITTKKVDPAQVTVVEGHFVLDPEDKAVVPAEYRECLYVVGRRLDNKAWHRVDGGPKTATWADVRKEVSALKSFADSRVSAAAEAGKQPEKPSAKIDAQTSQWTDATTIDGERALLLRKWLEGIAPHIGESNKAAEKRRQRVLYAIGVAERRAEALKILDDRMPVFVLFNNYFRVRPLIHLEHLAQRIETGVLDDSAYDYGNQCLLNLLGFSARDLSALGKAAEPPAGNKDALQKYRDQLDKRSYQLNAASVRLTAEIRRVWLPDPKRDEAARLRVQADGQYLKVVVEDDLGVEIELDQRSEGFQWLVSFFVVFFAEAADAHENAILLLDEPGVVPPAVELG